MRKITAEESRRLFQFTERHYVEHRDVQMELVDHLANAIEARWLEEPEAAFEKLLKEEFRKFGVFGFMEIVEQRQKIMEKIYLKMIWRHSLQLLLEPLFLIAAAVIFTIARIALQSHSGETILMAVIIAEFFCLALLAGLRKRNFRKKMKKKERKPYLLDDLISTTGQVNLFLPLGINFINLLYLSDINFAENFWLSNLLALIVAFQFLLSYIIYFRLPGMKNKILKATYPQLRLD